MEVAEGDGTRVDVIYQYGNPNKPSNEAIAVALAQDARAAFWEGPTVVVRVYPGRTQMEAANLFQRDAAHAARFGYAPTAQSWSEGKPGLGRVVMLGFYSMVVKPKGYLTVTYTKSVAATAEPAGASMKVCPMCAEDVKAAARICRYCRYEFEPISEQ